MEKNYLNSRRSSRSQFIKSLHKNQERISKFSFKTDETIGGDGKFANFNRGLKFQKDQRTINLQRFQEELMKKAKLGMTEEEFKQLNFKPNFFVHGKSLRFGENSFYILGEQSKFRKSLVWLMEWKYFDRVITFTILLNTIILILQDYKFRLNVDNEIQWQRELINYSEIIFTLIFLFEFLVKSLAMGLIFEENTYLRDGWNIIDFIVVITSIISFSPGLFNMSVSAIRVTRILRPLRSINYIQGIRILIGSMLQSLPDLGNVLIFLTFIITLFGILGLQLFMDAFENRCRVTEFPLNGYWEIDQSILYLCNESKSNSCPVDRYCRNPLNYPEYNVNEYQESTLDYEEFNFGFTKFDDIRYAVFTIFQSLTTEGWTKIVFMLADTYNKPLVYTYFVCLILLGSFFVVNLILAVINESFIDQHKKNQQKIMKKQKLANLEENLAKNKKTEKNQKKVADSILDYIKDDKNDGIQEIAPPTQSLYHSNNNLENQEQNNKKEKQNNQKLVLQNITNIDDLESCNSTNNMQTFTAQKSNFQNMRSNLNKSVCEEEDEQKENQQPKKGLSKFREKIKDFVNESRAFLGFTTLCILVNTIILALDKYPQDKATQFQLEYLNTIFTLVFALEMIIKVFGLGFKGYLQDKFNIFDGLIVILSLVDIFFQQTNISNISSNGGFAAITAFRSLRLFRIFKLARSWVNLRHLLLAIWKTLSQIIYFLILVILFIVVTSLLGMEFFAYKVRFNPQSGSPALTPEEKFIGIPPRINFDTFYNGIITIFVLLTNEDWNTILYEHMRGMNSWWPSAFYIAVVVVGNFMLLKLFLAILIYNFGKAKSETIEQEQQQQQYQKRRNFRRQSDKISMWQKLINKFKKIFNIKKKNKQNDNTEISQFQQRPAHMNTTQHFDKMLSTTANISYNKQIQILKQNEQESMHFTKKQSIDTHIQQNQHTFIQTQQSNVIELNESNFPLRKNISMQSNSALIQSPAISSAGMQNSNGSKFFGDSFQNKIRKRGTMARFSKDDRENIIQRRSLYLFGPKNKLRVEIHKLVKMQQFEACIIMLIIFSSIILVIDSPMEDPNEDYKVTLYYIDIFVTILFALECGLKIIAFGFLFNGKNSYMRTYWNILDFLVVIFSIAGFFVNDSLKFEKLKIFRILRIFRPLRLISRNKGLKVAINSLINSIPSIVNLLIVCLIFFLLFGIFGTNYFKGSFFYCDLHNIQKSFHIYINNKTDCLDYGGDWINNDFNFDNIINSSIYLFVLSTTEGWVSMMQNGIDSVGQDQQPQQENQKGWIIFYIFFIIVGSFFIMNLFAGIVVDSFNQEKNKIGGLSCLTSEQKDWIEVQIRIFNTEPQNKIEVKNDANFIKKGIYKLVTHQYFEFFILSLIIMNTLVFMAVWHKQSQDIRDNIKYINVGFLVIFALEVLLKLISLGFEYFKDSWNQFDMCIVILSFIGLVLEYTQIYYNIGTTTSIIRCFRIARVLRLLKKQKSIQMIFNTFIATIPALANIGALLFLVLFLFSVLGMNLFPYVKINKYTMGINEKANFQTFYDSFFLLLKCSTGESWNLVLADIVRPIQPNFACFDIQTYAEYKEYGINGCGTSIGYAFLIIFQLLFSMVVLSLFVAVILEGFEKTMKDEHSVVKPYYMQQFSEKWQIYDKKGLGLLKVQYMIPFINKLEQPLGWKGTILSQQKKRIKLAQMDIPIYKLRNLQSPYLFYYDVLIELSRHALQQQLPMGSLLEPENTVQIQKDLNMQLKYKLNQYRNLKVTEYTTADYIAVQIMVERYRVYMQNKANNKLRSQKISVNQNEYPILEEPEYEEKSPAIQQNNTDAFFNGSQFNQLKKCHTNQSISNQSSSILSSSVISFKNQNKTFVSNDYIESQQNYDHQRQLSNSQKYNQFNKIQKISNHDVGIIPDTERGQISYRDRNDKRPSYQFNLQQNQQI